MKHSHLKVESRDRLISERLIDTVRQEEVSRARAGGRCTLCTLWIVIEKNTL
jgi:hypothetical protein